ncbi:potassium channel subfamily K member 3-like, partial [Schistocerca cancellata]|uniref:potassium channel subfamily K member 3-like n=1 Tax=Schistocerca cancellata TaxID=274614 RepID=UPI002119044C
MIWKRCDSVRCAAVVLLLVTECRSRPQDTLVRNLRGGGVLRPGGGGGGAAGGGAYGYGYGGHHHRWSFSSSFLYSLTLITTIGYGSVSPRTPWGKVVTIVYALVGIPLMLVYLSTVGDVLARSFRRLYGRLCGLGGGGGAGHHSSAKAKLAAAAGVGVGVDYPHKAVNSIAADGKLLYPHHRHSADSDDFCKSVVLDCGGEGIAAGASPLEAPLPPPQPAPAARVPVSLCLCIVVAYVCAGALLFNRLENWTFLEGSFFCFTSLGTIGFGDLVPGGLDGTAHQQLSVIASSAYILVGMALVAMCFNLVQDEVVLLVRRVARNFRGGGGSG